MAISISIIVTSATKMPKSIPRTKNRGLPPFVCPDQLLTNMK